MTDVYWNRHRWCWSLRERGRVVGYADEVHMHDVTFVVSVPAVMRYRRTDTRAVCAVARGTLGYRPRGGRAQIVRFAPDFYTTFVTDDRRPVAGCEELYLSPQCDTLAWGLRWL